MEQGVFLYLCTYMHIYLCVTILIKVKEAINLIVVGAYGMSCGLKTERKLNVPFLN